MSWQNFLYVQISDVLYFKVTRISLKHSVEKEEQVEKNVPVPKFSSMRLDVSIEHRLVTDTGKQLDRHRVIASGALAWRREGKNDGLRQSINQSINQFMYRDNTSHDYYNRIITR